MITGRVGNCRVSEEASAVTGRGSAWRAGGRGPGPSANIGEGNERRETVGASWFGSMTMTAGF